MREANPGEQQDQGKQVEEVQRDQADKALLESEGEGQHRQPGRNKEQARAATENGRADRRRGGSGSGCPGASLRAPGSWPRYFGDTKNAEAQVEL